MSRLFVSLLVVLAIAALAHSKSKPKPASTYFSLCRRNDPALNECVRKAMTDVRPRLMKGIPALGLVPIEPLVIPRMELNQGAGTFSLKTTLTNFKIHGLGAFTVTDVNLILNDKKLMFNVTMTVPKLDMTAGYEMGGQILVIPIQGNGTCEMNFTDVHTVARTLGNVVERDGEKYIDLTEIKWDIAINGKARSWFYNLFNGDKRLGDATNNFLNNNAQEAFQAYKHLPEEAFGQVFKELSSKVYTLYPINQLFLDD